MSSSEEEEEEALAARAGAGSPPARDSERVRKAEEKNWSSSGDEASARSSWASSAAGSAGRPLSVRPRSVCVRITKRWSDDAEAEAAAAAAAAAAEEEEEVRAALTPASPAT